MITVIGDVHGKYDRYSSIVNNHDYTVQLGDFGFKHNSLDNIDSTKHFILPGNHDNYDTCYNYSHFLGDYGYTSLNRTEFFYYRGAYSIDRSYRTVGVDYWENEQVSVDQFLKARELYRQIKPKIVFSHDCPEVMIPTYIGNTARIYQNVTSWALNELFNNHQPDLWVHGHYHVSKTTTFGKTKFVCLGELETLNIA